MKKRAAERRVARALRTYLFMAQHPDYRHVVEPKRRA